MNNLTFLRRSLAKCMFVRNRPDNVILLIFDIKSHIKCSYESFVLFLRASDISCNDTHESKLKVLKFPFDFTMKLSRHSSLKL